MSVKSIISDFLSQANRNRLVFCHEHIDGLSFVNLGKGLAENLAGENLRSPMIAFAAEDFVGNLLSSSKEDPVIGPYIALENIGILFEPELSFNIRTILENASTNKTVVILSDGYIDSDRYYFLQKGDTSSIDLHGLSYIDIY